MLVLSPPRHCACVWQMIKTNQRSGHHRFAHSRDRNHLQSQRKKKRECIHRTLSSELVANKRTCRSPGGQVQKRIRVPRPTPRPPGAVSCKHCLRRWLIEWLCVRESECQGSFTVSGVLSPTSEKPHLTLDLVKRFPVRPVDSRRCGANSDICSM